MEIALTGSPRPGLASQPGWYRAEHGGPDPALEPAKEAFQEALAIFTNDMTKDKAKIDLANRSESLQGVLEVVATAQKLYDDERRHERTQKWLVKFSKRVSHYGKVMDVLVQHNPEYVSLAWGAMKFLFIAVINHHNLVAALSKGLTQIASVLPKMELSAILYPTDRMKHALAEIYAVILRFLIRANGWFTQSRLARALEAISRPKELRYDDLLADIESATRQFDSLALAASHAEQRDMHLLLLEVRQKLVEQQQFQMTAQLNTHLALSDLQFAQILNHVSNVALESPEKTLQVALFQRNRARVRGSRAQPPSLADEFWLAPKFKAWTASPNSSLIMIQGTHALRTHIRDFLAGMVECVRGADVPILWALRSAVDGQGQPKISVVDLLKYLTSQALKLRKAVPESVARITCARFQTATTEAEWVELLSTSLGHLGAQSQVYIVVDVELLSGKLEPLARSLSLPEAFWALFQQLTTMPTAPVLKVVLVSYGSAMFHTIEADKRDYILPVRGSATMKRPAQRVLAQGRRPLRGAASFPIRLR